MRRFLVICAVMVALLIPTAALAGGDGSSPAYVVSCTDAGEIAFEGTAAQADAWVAGHVYPDTGCWVTAYDDPGKSGLPLAPGATTTTTTVPPTTTTTVPPTTSTTTVPPTTTTTTRPPKKPITWVKWCLKNPTYIGKRCPTHTVPAP